MAELVLQMSVVKKNMEVVNSFILDEYLITDLIDIRNDFKTFVQNLRVDDRLLANVLRLDIGLKETLGLYKVNPIKDFSVTKNQFHLDILDIKVELSNFTIVFQLYCDEDLNWDIETSFSIYQNDDLTRQIAALIEDEDDSNKYKLDLYSYQ